MRQAENTRLGAYEIPSQALVEWLWWKATWQNIQREAERVRAALKPQPRKP